MKEISKKKERLDVALVERGLIESREKAQRLIMAGEVRVNDVPVAKASHKVTFEDRLELTKAEKYVSRGGLKLEAALEHFKISCHDRICLDLGASTGGFTDCLIQNGARQVYAVDVGENQIAWKLRSDRRVKVLDDVNARYLKPEALGNPLPDLVTADVSFISVCKILPAAYECSGPRAEFVILIKPQFEAGRESVEKGGVVRDPAVHERTISAVKQFVESHLKGDWRGVTESPITGPAGNKEFLAWFFKK
jgi:23S rRNA (cytidine1920-2'-O)/16S rRNA (cytidine1409-2'-O)-methyltransferase